MAKTKTTAETPDLAANIAKATAVKPEKTPGRFNVPAAPPPVAPVDPEILKRPVVEGSPCQRKGCPGNYSILQTVRDGRQLKRLFICRTCQQKPQGQ